MKQIFPLVDAKGFNITIPLPGRTLIDEKAKEDYFKNLEILENQIKECDIMFLLTDSRESRWYPTVNRFKRKSLVSNSNSKSFK